MSPSSQWEILDFEEVEKSLAKKLTDNDLYAVLSCIKETVKILKLTGCIKITGRGLEPLQESTTLELLDLSMLKQHESSSTILESRMSEEVVIPILDSIISVQGSSLKYIQFPRELIRSRSELLVNFENSYMQHLRRLGISCSKCNNVMRGRRHTSLNGIRFCCYSCLKPICVHCEGTSQTDTNCGICKKVYCSGCSRVNQRDRCAQCHMTVCSGCSNKNNNNYYLRPCSECRFRSCIECLRNCQSCREMNLDLDWFEDDDPYFGLFDGITMN